MLPLDLAEATFIVENFHSGLSTSDLLILRARQIARHPDDITKASETLRKARFTSKNHFERKFIKKLTRAIYQPGELVLVRNTAVEMSHDRKHKPRYLGPYEVAERTIKGNYKLKELDGTELQYKYAAFRILPYITRHHSFMKNNQEKEDSNDSNDNNDTENSISDQDSELESDE
jgi:hypothetical protein